jgi:PIF1-like helicase
MATPNSGRQGGVAGKLVADVSKGSNLARLILETTIIIWDEVLIINKLTFEAVDRTLRDLYDTPDIPFNRKPFLSGGDFAQILPVIEGANRAATIAASLQRSSL